MIKNKEILYIDKKTNTAKVYLIILQNPGSSNYDIAKIFLKPQKIIELKKVGYNQKTIDKKLRKLKNVKLEKYEAYKICGFITNLRKKGLIIQKKRTKGRKVYKNYVRLELILEYYDESYYEVNKEKKKILFDFVSKNSKKIFKVDNFNLFKIDTTETVLKQIMRLLRDIQACMFKDENEILSSLSINLDGVKKLEKIFGVQLEERFLKLYSDDQHYNWNYIEFDLLRSRLKVRIWEYLKKLKDGGKVKKIMKVSKELDNTQIFSPLFPIEKELPKLIKNLRRLESSDIEDAIEELKRL
jgi:hypothetical protein